MTSDKELSPFRYAYRSLTHRWRVNLAILLGAIVGTAVLTGALLVGDSVKYSLRRLTLERLGRIDSLLFAEHFFSPEIAQKRDVDANGMNGVSSVQPLILLPQTTVETQGTERQRAGNVALLGAWSEFWKLSSDASFPSPPQPEGREIVINQSLAEDLQAEVGTRLIVRLPDASRVPSESPLGEKVDRVSSLAELEVIAIVPSSGLGRFSLRPSQASPRVAWVDPLAIQERLDQPGRVNALIVATNEANRALGDAPLEALQSRLQLDLDDAGLTLKSVSLTYQAQANEESKEVFRYFSLSTDTMMFAPAAERAIDAALAGVTHQSVTTYLANAIRLTQDGDERPPISYSTVTALDAESPITPLVDTDGNPIGPLGDDEIVLNSWAAEDRSAKLGDRVEVSYFAPETTHGETDERTVELTLKAIVPITTPDTPYESGEPAGFRTAPTRANDPDLTPAVPGITDQESIGDWDPPFPFDYDRIRDPEDEDYWDFYRTTPKAFVNRTTGEKLWGSRFGKTTSYRIESDSTEESELRARISDAIQADLGAFGFQWLRLKRDGLRASQGTTPFNALFLGFSFFIIAAALMLVALLTRLGLEQRTKEAGLLMASGLNSARVRRLFLYEATVLALLGAVLGVLLGIAYAALMLIGLKTWWLAAIVSPFIELSISPLSLVAGAVLGLLATYVTLGWTIRQFTRLSPHQLLTGNVTKPSGHGRSKQRRWIVRLFWAGALISVLAAAFLSGEAQAGAFFGCGACVLIALLMQVANHLAHPPATDSSSFSRGALVTRNIARNPSRSVLTLGLMATACFLIVAISAFRLAPTEQGTGGFNLIAESDIAIFEDLNDPAVRQDLLANDAETLEGSQIFGFRVKDGDDASCRNLYKSQRPRVLGVTSDFVKHFDGSERRGFRWGALLDPSNAETLNPWQLLNRPIAEGHVPVVIDKNTAMYSLHLFGGPGERFEVEYETGVVKFEVVALLTNSILQGSLLTSEQHMIDVFPSASGYRFFCIDAPEEQADKVVQTLENVFADQGFLTFDSAQQLADLMAVQNTYLSTFQSLGGLGLLLGTLGLVAVQLRSVFERRRELSLMRATGFRRRQIASLVLREHASLLVIGVGIGVLAALFAVLPQSLTTEVHPPWRTLVTVILAILVVGLMTGWLALRPVMKLPLVASLRDE